MLLKRIPDRGLGLGLCLPIKRWCCSHTPGHGFDHRLLKGPEAGDEGTAPALQDVTEGRTPARVRFQTDPGQKNNRADIVFLWTHWSRDGILCEGLVKPEGVQGKWNR